MTPNAAENLTRHYERLIGELGPQGWWPAEVILGAILTQNTSWRDAARAIGNLREARLLDLSRLRAESGARLQSFIRPAGFFRQKARTIRAFVDWLDAAHGGSLRCMFARPAGELRSALLGVKGLGPETVDAILLYAGRKPLFVADTNSRRILARYGMLVVGSTYAEAQEFVHQHSHRTRWYTTNSTRFLWRWVSGIAEKRHQHVVSARSKHSCLGCERQLSRRQIENHSTCES